MKAPVFMKIIVYSFLSVAILCGCQNLAHRGEFIGYDKLGHPQYVEWPRESLGPHQDGSAAIMFKKAGLKRATLKEISIARATELCFKGHQPLTSDGKVRIAFHRGNRQPLHGNSQTHYSSLSFYSIEEARSGEMKARIRSVLSNQNGADSDPRIWVSETGQRILIFERWHDGCGEHLTCALVSRSSDQASWAVKYLGLPIVSVDFTENSAVPLGLCGEDLLLSETYSGAIYKIPLRELREVGFADTYTIG